MKNLMKLLQRKRRMSKWLVPELFLFLAVGGGVFFFCGLHSVSGKYMYQESRTDVIHTTRSYTTSGFSADMDEELAGETAPAMSLENEDGLFSDGSQWDLQGDLEEAEFFADNAEEDTDLYGNNLMEADE